MDKSSDSTRPQPRPGILEINIYKPGVAKVKGVENPIKLSANETPLGPSPKAIAAFEATAQSLERWGALSENIQRAGFIGHDPDDDGVWDAGKHKGEKWSFDKHRDAVLNPTSKEESEEDWYLDRTGAIGNLGNWETHGEAWAHVPEEQQVEITRRYMEENLYTPDKGDVIISSENQDRAKEIYNEVLNPAQEEENQNAAE